MKKQAYPDKWTFSYEWLFPLAWPFMIFGILMDVRDNSRKAIEPPVIVKASVTYRPSFY